MGNVGKVIYTISFSPTLHRQVKDLGASWNEGETGLTRDPFIKWVSSFSLCLVPDYPSNLI